MPLAVRRVLNLARRRGRRRAAQLVDGWMIEPVRGRGAQIWIWGAGHVGRALVHTLAPLPDLRVTWIDTDARAGSPTRCRTASRPLVAADPAALVAHAPGDAEHLILTYQPCA